MNQRQVWSTVLLLLLFALLCVLLFYPVYILTLLTVGVLLDLIGLEMLTNAGFLTNLLIAVAFDFVLSFYFSRKILRLIFNRNKLKPTQ